MSETQPEALQQVDNNIAEASCSFCGTLTAEIRELIRRKRRSLGISRYRLANILGVCLSTVCKWERGKIDVCHPSHARLLASFLRGHYDQHFKGGKDSVAYTSPPWASLPGEVIHCLERATAIYRICSPHPDLQAGLVDGLDDLIAGTLRKALARTKGDSAGHTGRKEDAHGKD